MNYWKGISILLLAACCTGCEPRSAAVVPVSGTITLDGHPLAGATINFQPITDKASAAQAGIGSYGKTDEQGRYSLQLITPDEPGALVGRHIVTVTTAVAADPASDVFKLKQPERIPAHLRKLEFTVPMNGTDQANFGLSSR